MQRRQSRDPPAVRGVRQPLLLGRGAGGAYPFVTVSEVTVGWDQPLETVFRVGSNCVSTALGRQLVLAGGFGDPLPKSQRGLPTGVAARRCAATKRQSLVVGTAGTRCKVRRGRGGWRRRPRDGNACRGGERRPGGRGRLEGRPRPRPWGGGQT